MFNLVVMTWKYNCVLKFENVMSFNIIFNKKTAETFYKIILCKNRTIFIYRTDKIITKSK